MGWIKLWIGSLISSTIGILFAFGGIIAGSRAAGVENAYEVPDFVAAALLPGILGYVYIFRRHWRVLIISPNIGLLTCYLFGMLRICGLHTTLADIGRWFLIVPIIVGTAITAAQATNQYHASKGQPRHGNKHHVTTREIGR